MINQLLLHVCNVMCRLMHLTPDKAAVHPLFLKACDALTERVEGALELDPSSTSYQSVTRDIQKCNVLFIE